MALTLPEFIARWQSARLTERSAAQQHFLDLCALLGEPTPAAADPTGTSYTFERGVAKAGGGRGFADVWKRGFFAFEYKGPHKDLAAAYQQLLQYREDLENPPLLVVCDLNRFEVHTNFTGTAKRVYAFDLAALGANQPTPTCPLPPLDVLRAVFTAPERLRPTRTTADVTQEAAAEFARLAGSLRTRGADPPAAAHFLMRLLFCLVAEDLGLLPAGLFTKLVESTRTRPVAFAHRLRVLFGVMATGGAFGADDIAHFDGGLFADDAVLELTEADLAILARAGTLDWASVEPAIFGTLFERSLDPAKRSQLGAHYTSRADILLIVEPVLMAPLRRRWTAAQAQAGELVAKRDVASGVARVRAQQALIGLLVDFAGEIAAVRVLDPACGSGNFLYVALKQLLDLEKEVVTFAATHAGQTFFPQVNPQQLYGIEVNPYAHELASIVVWIGYIQWLHDNGFGVPGSPILKPLHNIQQMDAILAYDADRRPVEPDWPAAEVIIGNPPFLGGNRIRKELGDDYVNALFNLYEDRVPALADLVCYWFEHARAQIVAGATQRAGLLATQGIRGGANRHVLERIKQTGDIFLAWSDRDWVLNGATVHVSIVGFDQGNEHMRTLNGQPVAAINTNLTSATDLTQAQPLVENKGLCLRADEKGGPFEIPALQARQLLAAPQNINGRPNSDVVRRWVNALDIMQRPRDLWIIDFGEQDESAAAQYEQPYEYIRQVVYPERQKTREERTRTRWWQHRRPGLDMRQALASRSRYIATPATAKHRAFVWLDHQVLPDHQLYVFARDDDYFFGILHAKPHELWARATGTQLREAESGFRYTPTSTFETFPFPWPPGQEPAANPQVAAIAAAARDLVAKRDAWLNPPGADAATLKERTLTNLYNQRPTWLAQAHARLDAAVLTAYGWPADLPDAAILSRLLTLNQARASATAGVSAGNRAAAGPPRQNGLGAEGGPEVG